MSKLPKKFEERLAFSGLTPEEKEQIRARAVEQIAKEKRDEATEAYLNQALDEERRKGRPQDTYEDLLIDLPGHAVHVMIDGVEFLHAFTYNVTGNQAATIREIVQRAWDHEDEIGGANRNFYKKPRHLTLRRNAQNVSTTRILGA